MFNLSFSSLAMTFARQGCSHANSCKVFEIARVAPAECECDEFIIFLCIIFLVNRRFAFY